MTERVGGRSGYRTQKVPEILNSAVVADGLPLPVTACSRALDVIVIMERAGYTVDDYRLQAPRPSRSSGSQALLKFKEFSECRLQLISKCLCVFGQAWLYSFLFCSTAPQLKSKPQKCP